MKQFYKFYKRDSIKHLKRLNRQIRKSWDSVARANRDQHLTPAEISEMNRSISVEVMDSLKDQIRICRSILSDSTSSDSLKAIAKNRAKDLTITRLRHDPNYPALESLLISKPDSMSWSEIEGKFSCYADFGGFGNIDIRNFLFMFQCAYLTIPFETNIPKWLNEKKISEDEFFYLIERGRIKIVLIQPEQRHDIGFLNSVYRVNPNAIISRRALHALIQTDIVELSDSYLLNDQKIVSGMRVL